MALLTISGEPASRWEEVAHCAARLLNFDLVTEARLNPWTADEFGDAVPDRVWRPAVVSILARMAASHHLVIAVPGAEGLFRSLPIVFRAAVVAPEARRVGNLMLDQRLERPAARKELAALDAAWSVTRRARLGRAKAPADSFDVTLNAEHLDAGQMAEILKSAMAARGLAGANDDTLLSTAAEAQIQFQTRLDLARHGIVPAGRASSEARRLRPSQRGNVREPARLLPHPVAV